MDSEPSATAVGLAVARGRHRLRDEPPWVFDDPFALPLTGPVWRRIERRARQWRPELDRGLIGWAVGRARYAEDCLEAAGALQYVILGAGLDSFAWRRPDLARALSVYEVDHPASQQWKRRRAEEIGLPSEPLVRYVPVDFEKETLAGALTAGGFRWDEPTFFSWLGVTMYLTLDAIAETLAVVAGCAPGSEIVLTYKPPATHLDELGREYDALNDPAVASFGEPMVTRASPTEVEGWAGQHRLAVAEHPDHATLVERYFARRGDGLRPHTAERLVRLRVGAPNALHG